MRRPVSAMVLVCLATAAQAQEAETEGRKGLHIAPRVGATAIYDDNVFLERRDGEDDFALRFEPGVEATWARSKLRAGVDLGLDGRFYLENEDLSEVFWDGEAYLEYRPREDLLLKVSDHYVPAALQLGAPEDTVVNQEQANWLRGEMRWERDLARKTELEVGLLGTRFDTRGFTAVVDLDGDGMLEESRVDVDFWEARGWIEGRREVGRDREVFTRFTTARRTYPDLESADFVEYFGTVGLRAALTPRIRLDLAAGWGVLDFDEQSSESRFVGELGLTYELPRDWTLRLSAARSLSSDVVGTDFAETSARLEVRKKLGRRTTVIAAAYWSEFDNNAIDQEQNEVLAGELRLLRELTPRIQTELAWRRWKNTGDFENDDFTQDRVTLGVVYRY